ncbi:MAG: YraN family protein [Burkholderiales bacterium]|nr:YraN family protein [Burkholderiales bacterium]
MVTGSRLSGRWGGAASAGDAGRPATKPVGDAAEQRALAHLQGQGLRLECRNYRLAGGPHVRGAEIDLILRERDGTLVFVEVRARADARAGGAAASVTLAKQRRIVRAAQHYLMRLAHLPPCRFDVVAIDGDTLQWIRGAFDAA